MQLGTLQQSIAQQQQQNMTGKFVLHKRPIYSTSHSKPCASIGVLFHGKEEGKIYDIEDRAITFESEMLLMQRIENRKFSRRSTAKNELMSTRKHVLIFSLTKCTDIECLHARQSLRQII